MPLVRACTLQRPIAFFSAFGKAHCQVIRPANIGVRPRKRRSQRLFPAVLAKATMADDIQNCALTTIYYKLFIQKLYMV